MMSHQHQNFFQVLNDLNSLVPGFFKLRGVKSLQGGREYCSDISLKSRIMSNRFFCFFVFDFGVS